MLKQVVCYHEIMSALALLIENVIDTPLLLSYYQSLLSLLQQLCQTKSGAIHVLKAGLFEAVRESQLFAADPDIGIG